MTVQAELHIKPLLLLVNGHGDDPGQSPCGLRHRVKAVTKEKASDTVRRIADEEADPALVSTGPLPPR